MSKQVFQIVVMDPPYGFKDTLKMSDIKRSAQSNYSTMSIQDIKSLPIKDITDPSGSLLALWVPSSLLSDGLDIMKSYGFAQKQTWVWVKLKKDPFQKIRSNKNIDWDKIDFNDFLSFGMGHLGRNVHEIALIGVRGKIYKKIKNKSQRTVFFYQNTKHSQKPELLQDKLDTMFPDASINRLELFARRERQGYICLGNEIGSCEDIRESIL